MKFSLSFVFLVVLLLCTTNLNSQTAPSTFLELGLYWGTLSGPQITNATTTLEDSHGNIIAKMTGAWPHTTLALPFDVYTVRITAPVANGHPALSYQATFPFASSFGTSLTVKNWTVRIAFSLDAQSIIAWQQSSGGTG